METVDDLISVTNRAVAHPFRLPHQAAEVAMNLFLLARVHQLADDPRVVELEERFHEALGDQRPEDVLANQLRYASRLAAAPGPLSYEEIHKLFSLADEVHALRSLGYDANDDLLSQFESDLRGRFAAQPKPARLVANDKVKNWNRQLWWYAENMP